MADFSHLDAAGNPRMVDVSTKINSHRLARARAIVVLPPEVLEHFDGADTRTRKGGVFQTAIIAGIMAAKRTSELIPLCHPLGLDHCDVQIRLNALREVEIECTASITARTGVEMEALTGASVAALTVYDMCKALSPHIVVRDVRLVEKTGGKKDVLIQESPAAPLCGLVLAGGRSKRMGQDKSMLHWHGRPQWAHLVELLESLGLESFLSCRPEQAQAFPSGLALIPDTFLEMGPLGAILSAFRHRPDAAWLVVACDMPLLDAPTLRFLLENRRPAVAATSFRAPAFADGQSPDPLAAIWEPRIYPSLLQGLAEGRTCARKALLRVETWLIEPPDPAALSNVNTPEELATLQGRLGH